MGKGIRELAMSPEEENPPSENGFKPYPLENDHYSRSNWDKDRYDGNYNSTEYHKRSKWEEEEERKDLIEIKLNITYKELGKEYVDDEGYIYDNEKAEFHAKELAYDKLIELLGKGFESKWTLSKIEATDYYECLEVEITLTPIKD